MLKLGAVMENVAYVIYIVIAVVGVGLGWRWGRTSCEKRFNDKWRAARDQVLSMEHRVQTLIGMVVDLQTQLVLLRDHIVSGHSPLLYTVNLHTIESAIFELRNGHQELQDNINGLRSTLVVGTHLQRNPSLVVR